MQTIGLIGGMSWESTSLYYQLINQGIKHRLGGLHSAKIVLVSVDFAEIEALQRAGDWDAAGRMLADAARSIEAAGADFLLICTNTMHKVAPEIATAIDRPLLHLADATADAIVEAGHRRVALLGTRFTMEETFYIERLEARGIDVLVPDADDRRTVDRVIYDELCLGVIDPGSKRAYEAIITRLVDDGADAVIAGCTEIGLLIQANDCPVPLLDTTRIHAERAVARALQS